MKVRVKEEKLSEAGEIINNIFLGRENISHVSSTKSGDEKKGKKREDKEKREIETRKRK